MEDKQFDDKIRNAAQKNLSVSSNFDWENMNITIPQHQSRMRTILPVFFLNGIILAGILYVLIPSTSVRNTGRNTNYNNSASHLNRYNLETPIQNEEVIITHGISKNKISTQNKISLFSSNEIEEKFFFTGNTRQSNQQTSVDFAIVKQGPNLTIQKKSDLKGNKHPSLESCQNSALISLIPSPQPKPISITSNKFSIPKNYPSHLNNSTNPTNNFSKYTLEISTGINSCFEPNGTEYFSQSLGPKSIGQTYRVTLINNSSLAWYSVGFEFNRLHHYYEQSRDIGHVNNLENYQRIYSTRSISHNNYIRTFHMNFTIGKSFWTSPSFSIGAALTISPGINLNSTGSIFGIDNEQVFDLKEVIEPGQFLMATSVKLYASYQWRPKTSVFIQPEFNRHFNAFNLTQGVTGSVTPRILGISIGLIQKFERIK